MYMHMYVAFKEETAKLTGHFSRFRRVPTKIGLCCQKKRTLLSKNIGT